MSAPRDGLLVGRQEVLTRLTGILGDESAPGAVVVGAAGMGKTALASLALSSLDPVPNTVRIHPSATLSTVRFGALAPYLGSVQDTADVMAVLRELVDVLPRKAAGGEGAGCGKPLLVVDDAHFLDPASRFVLSQLVQTSTVRMLALGAGTDSAEGPADSALGVGQLPVLALEALDVEEVRTLCAEVLGGEVSAGTAEVVTSLTAGNPLLVRAWLRCAADQGAMVKNSGVWIVARPDPEPNAEMRDLVRGLHARLGTAQQETMELLALAGPLPRTTLAAAAAGGVEELLESGAAVVDRGGQIRIASNLYADVLRVLVPPGRSARLLQRWRTAAGTAAAPNHRQVLWAVECGERVPREDLKCAAAAANDALEPLTALHLCQAVGDDDAVALETARAMLGLGRPLSALSAAERVFEGPHDDAMLQAALAVAALAAWRTGASAPALEELAGTWERRIRDAGPRAGAGGGSGSPVLLAGLDILRLWARRLEGSLPNDAGQRLEELRRMPGATAEIRLLSTLLLSDVHWTAGRTDSAAAVAAEAWAALEAEPALCSRYCVQVIGRHALCLIEAGRYAQAAAFLDRHVSSDPREAVRRQGTVQSLRGLLHMRQGRLAEAVEELREGTAALSLADPLQLLPLATGLLDLLRAETGTGSGEGAAVHPPVLAYRGPYDLWLLARAFAAAAGTALGEDRGGTLQPAGTLGSLAGEARAKGLPLVHREIRALACLREDGKPDQGAFRLLGEAAEGLEGPRSRTLGRIALIGDATDPGRLETAAGEAEQAGEVALAAELLGHAVLLHAERGEDKLGGHTLRRLHLLTRGLGTLCSRTVLRARSHGELTSRERDIVRLAAEGNSNRQIAKVLTLSQRTVEGHLYRIYLKLGIGERSELSDFR
ncbi:hypothetical protein NCCP1664_11880 [Zafaria cholistanensis]|uniref:HTH luxR-type domain-containing protein n=1 Tax=Zafaria cholistanensis TaxID=1682741 RepID=A0A5A7NSF6_9MICC|nr:LuxR family transcriptional regulator [Zafaria cholistanensis]GER22691.1 hypothetical protein NCCP1664_11880 [Zafaria cholistanensis]